MRKLLFLVYLFFIVIIPLKINAISLSSANITGSSYQETGDEFTLYFDFNIKDITMDSEETTGVFAIGFKLDYDESVFIPLTVSSSDFDVYAVSEDDGIYIIGLVKDNLGTVHTCAHGQLFCYEKTTIQMSFYVKDTNKTSSFIGMTEPTIMIVNLSSPSDTIDSLDDNRIKELTTKSVKHSINITQTKSQVTKEPTSGLKTTSKVPTSSSKKTSTKKSNNANLKSLVIEGHKILFDKDKLEYNLIIKNDENVLNITTTTEDSKAKYKIIGADDLESNSNKVNIIVTAEDGTQKTYVIIGKKNNKREELIGKNQENENNGSNKDIKVDKNILIYIGIGLGIFFLIICIIFIKSKINDHKLNKLLDKM